ncbi:MAG: LON peptidase substrate-binding domain-containing protein [Ignavibacteriales bacterium]|nr:LON peptidase substrate-binding domain-containing protein [Ignavibacteriales bacterium]
MVENNPPSEILPLFPLNVVLFPQSQLPLHIFEDRYKTLISECITYDIVFGINFVHEQQMRSIGCTASVKEVTKRYPDGRIDIVVEGRRRYTLHNIVEAPHPYYSGRISWYNDIHEEVDDILRLKAVHLHNEFVRTVFQGSVAQVHHDDIRKTRAFHLVQKSGLDLVQRQVFLSMNSENTRLGFLINHLESMLPLLVSKKKTEELAKNDGYIQE